MRLSLHTAALGALLIAGAGCPAKGPAATTGGSGTPAAAATFTPDPAPADPLPKPAEPYVRQVRGNHGGTLTMAVPGDLGSLHPLKTVGATDQQVRNFIYDGLTDYDNKEWKVIPGLATKWEHDAAGLVWTYTLRRGVQWSDGEAFDADDVVFTYTELFKESFVGSEKDILKDSQGRLPTVEKLDAHTVRFTIQERSALFVSQMSNAKILPQHQWQQAADENRFMEILKVGDDLTKMIGTGPFKIANYKTDEVIIFERNARHWRYDQDSKRLPYVDQVVIRIVPDQNTMYAKFLAGEFDLLEPLRPEDYEDARAKSTAAQGTDQAFTVHPLGPSLNTTYICVNQNPGKNPETGEPYVEPWKLEYFQNVKFRHAISHSIARQQIVDIVLKGRGVPLYTFTPPANKVWYYEHSPKFEYDKEKAKALLEEIGLKDTDGDGIRETPDGKKFSFVVYTNTENSTRVQTITMLQKDLADVGLEVIPKPITFTTLVSMLQSQFNYEAFVLGWASGVPPDPLQSKAIVRSDGELHVWHPQQKKASREWEQRIDDLINTMAITVDQAERKTQYDQIQEILGNQQAMIFMYSPNLYVATRANIRNLKLDILRPYTYWNLYELMIETKK